MIISYIKIYSEKFGGEEWLISTDGYDAELDKINIPLKSPLADKILETVSNNKSSFYLDATKFIIVKYLPEECEKQYNKYRTETINITSDNNIKIFVCANFMGCQKNHHNIESVCAVVECLNSNMQVKISINKCSTCNPPFYFIGYTSLKEYQKQYGQLLFKMEIHNSLLNSSDKYDRKQISKLRLLGYSVEQGGLNSEQRKMLLSRIIDGDFMEKHEMTSHLEYLIKQGESNYKMAIAVTKWQQDLKFILNYKNSNNVCCGLLYR